MRLQCTYLLIFSDTSKVDCVTVKDYDTFLEDLNALTEDTIWISDQMSYAIYERVPEVSDGPERILNHSFRCDFLCCWRYWDENN